MQRRTFEIAAAISTGLLKFLLVDLWALKFLFVVGACLFWIGYVIYTRSQNPHVFIEWGFGRDHLNNSFRVTAIFALGVFLVMAIVALFTNRFSFSIHMVPILLLYPIWGVIQQFLMMSLIGGNLQAMGNPAWVVVVATAGMFAIVHYPSWMMVGGTFCLALFYIHIFMKWPNIWALGIFHGWLGCFFFYWILDRDPWLEFIAMLG